MTKKDNITVPVKALLSGMAVMVAAGVWSLAGKTQDNVKEALELQGFTNAKVSFDLGIDAGGEKERASCYRLFGSKALAVQFTAQAAVVTPQGQVQAVPGTRHEGIACVVLDNTSVTALKILSSK